MTIWLVVYLIGCLMTAVAFFLLIKDAPDTTAGRIMMTAVVAVLWPVAVPFLLVVNLFLGYLLIKYRRHNNTFPNGR